MTDSFASNGAPEVLVVVPTYNEAKTLPLLIDRLRQLHLPGIRVLVVDDNSPDGTGQIADQLAAGSDWSVRVLHRPAKQGLGRAYVAGLQQALTSGAGVVIQMDADLSHPADAIPTMLTALLTSRAGLVIGSRYVPGGSVAATWPRRRRALSRWANAYVDVVLQLGVRDATAGFRAWRREALADIDLATLTSDGYAFQVETLQRAVTRGWPVIEVPIAFADRSGGASKMTLGVQLESAVLPWRLRLGAGAERRAHRRGRPGTRLHTEAFARRL